MQAEGDWIADRLCRVRQGEERVISRSVLMKRLEERKLTQYRAVR
jgi:hypothetical protein